MTIAAVAIAALMRWLLEPVLKVGAPFSTFTLAAIFATWYGGLRTGLLATVLGFILGYFLFVVPNQSALDASIPTVSRFVVYFIICLTIAGFGGAMRDAQQRSHLAEQLARQQAETLRITFASMGDAVITSDVSGNVTYLNAIAQMLTGWTFQDATGQPLTTVFRVMNEQTRQPLKNSDSEIEDHKRRFKTARSTILVGRDGTERVIEDSISLIRDDAGNVAGKVVIFRDISERRLTDVEREQSQQLIIMTLESITDAFLRFDRNWRFAYVNAEAERLMGRPRVELLGKICWNEELPAVGKGVEKEYLRAVAEQITIEFESYFEPGQRWFAIKGNPTAEGGLTVFFHDITESKRAQEALLHGEERLRLAVDATGLGIFDFLPQTGEQVWSERCKTIWGLPADARLTFSDVLNAVHPEDRAIVQQVMDESKDPSGQGEFVVEHRIVRPDDSIGWVLVQGKTVFEGADENRRPVRSLGTILDITERKQAEELLRLSEGHLARELIEMTELQELIARLMVCPNLESALDEVLDATMILLHADMGHIQLYNSRLDALEIVAQRGFRSEFLEHFRSVTRDDHTASGRSLTEGRRTVIEDVQADLSYQPHQRIAANAGYRGIQSTPLLGQNGVPLGMLSTHYHQPHRPTDRELRFLDLYARQAADFIERSRNELALRNSEARYRAIGEAIDFGVWMNDAEGKNIFASDSFLRLVGMTQEQCAGFGWRAALDPDDLANTIAAWEDCVRTGGPLDRELRFRGVDGRWHAILARGTPIKSDTGQTLGWVGINLDISRLKQAEDSLREADRRKDDFLATLAHELRNPLAPMRNAIQLFRMNDSSDSTLESARDVIDRQIQQMTRLIDDLLDVSRISRNKLQLRKERVTLKQIVESAVESSQPLIEEFGHTLSVDLPDEPLILDADATRLAQVFLNLLNNAAKYTEEGGRIDLFARRDDGEVTIAVVDNGIGIPRDKLPTLFQMFSQVEDSISRSQGGLGIGLSLVKRLVEMHGGRIEAKSDGLGTGSTFSVRLPLIVEAAPLPSSDLETTAPSNSKLSILVVDDNVDAADTLTLLLKMMGNEIRTVYDGEAAVQEGDDFRPDVVLLDIGLPKMNGYEVARYMRGQEWSKNSVLIAVTGWGQEDDKRQASEAGFDKHLVKPVNPRSLMKILAGIYEDKYGAAAMQPAGSGTAP